MPAGPCLHSACCLRTDLHNKNVVARLNSLKRKVQSLLNTHWVIFRIKAGTWKCYTCSNSCSFCWQLLLLRAPCCILCCDGQGNEALSLARAEGQPCLSFMPTREHISVQNNTGVADRFSWQLPGLTWVVPCRHKAYLLFIHVCAHACGSTYVCMWLWRPEDNPRCHP